MGWLGGHALSICIPRYLLLKPAWNYPLTFEKIKIRNKQFRLWEGNKKFEEYTYTYDEKKWDETATEIKDKDDKNDQEDNVGLDGSIYHHYQEEATEEENPHFPLSSESEEESNNVDKVRVDILNVVKQNE